MDTPSVQSRDPESVSRDLLRLIRELLAASAGKGDRPPQVSLDSRLEHDLGLDSLGRSELFARLEQHFGVRLPEQALLLETPRALLAAIHAAEGREPQRLPEQTVPELAAVHEPLQSATLGEALDWHVQAHPERPHILLYGDADDPEPMSYGELWQGAMDCAAGLAARGVRPGDRVALMLPTGREYFFGFFGSLLAGGVPVPIYPPTRPSQLEEHLLRHAGILENAGTGVLITIARARGVAQLLRLRVAALRHVVTLEELSGEGGGAQPLLGAAGDLAFLQYTSGSTGSPKGVMLTHAHLLANIRAMGRAVRVSSEDRFVSWLPLYHDMGLIGAWLGSLYFGLPLVVMSPLRFLARPVSWLQAIHRHRGTLSASPNFGYELCLNKVTADQMEGLDLGSWRQAFNGAEPVSPATLRRFAERFSAHGLRPNALAPVYGLAEAAVGLAFPPPGRGPLLDSVRRDALLRQGRAEPVSPEHPDALQLPACGHALPGYRVRVVDADSRELPERREGRLQFQGPSATSGYFRNPEATRRLFDGDWLDTGDRAYLAGSDIYITGRSKELIIRGGRNLYPYEVEQAVGELPGIRKGCVAVFAAADAASGTERVVVLAETRETGGETLERLRAGVRERATDLLGGPPDKVLLVPPHTVLKTSSGKVRRSTMRELFEQGLVDGGSRPVWWQVARVAGLGLASRLGNAWRRGGERLWAGWAWTVFCLLVPGVWLAVAVLPKTAWRWSAIRATIRLLRRLIGVPLRVSGLENLPPEGRPCVLVANHASYLDTLLLIEALPRDFAYVAKQELRQQFFARVFLQRLHTRFVERFDPRQGVEHSREFLPALGAGQSLAFFPEGTFRAEPGLLPFRMGAFVAAAGAGVPLLPVSLHGTRALLRADSWQPRRGPLRVTVHPTLQPDGDGWEAAARLRDAARRAILAEIGEH